MPLSVVDRDSDWNSSVKKTWRLTNTVFIPAIKLQIPSLFLSLAFQFRGTANVLSRASFLILTVRINVENKYQRPHLQPITERTETRINIISRFRPANNRS